MKAKVKGQGKASRQDSPVVGATVLLLVLLVVGAGLGAIVVGAVVGRVVEGGSVAAEVVNTRTGCEKGTQERDRQVNKMWDLVFKS